MANIRITDLPAAAATTGSEVLPVVQAGATVKVTASNLAVTANTTGGDTQTLGAWIGETQDDARRYNLASDGATDDRTALDTGLAAGGEFKFRPGSTTNIATWVDVPVDNTHIDLAGATLHVTDGANSVGGIAIGNVGTNVGTKQTVVKNGIIRFEENSLTGSLNLWVNSTDIIVSDVFMTSQTNHYGGIMNRTSGLRRVIISGAGFDAVNNVWYHDGDETQTWKSRLALNPIPGATTVRDLANAAHWTSTSGSVATDVANGLPFRVMSYDSVDATQTCLLDISGGTGKNSPQWTRAGSVLTFASALPTANKTLVVTTHNPAIQPADTQGVVIMGTITKELAGSPFTGNNPIFAYHVDRTSPASCAKDFVFVGNIWDNPAMPYTRAPWNSGGTAYISCVNLNGFHNIAGAALAFRNVAGQVLHIEDGSHNQAFAAIVSRDSTSFPYWMTDSENIVLNAFAFYNYAEGGIEYYAQDNTVPFIEQVDVYNKDVRAANGVIDAGSNAGATAGLSMWGSRNDDPMNVRVQDITVKNLTATDSAAVVLRGTQYRRVIGPDILARNTYHYGYTANELYNARIIGGAWENRGGGKTFKSTVSPTYFGTLLWEDPLEHYISRSGLVPNASPQTPHACFDLGQTAYGNLTGVLTEPESALSANRYRKRILQREISWNGQTLTTVRTHSGTKSSSFADLDYYVYRYVTAAVINAGGAGYGVGNVLTLAGTWYINATITVTSVSAGVITGVSISNAGHAFVQPGTGDSTVATAVTGGTGAGATFDLTIAGSELWCRPSIFSIAADVTPTTIRVSTRLKGEFGYTTTPTI